jgi:anti-sigma factor RsiW
MENEMACRELVELITDYLDGKLQDDKRMLFENHLAGCDGCSNYLEQIRQTIRLTGQLREESLTPQQRSDLLRMFRVWKKVG